MDYKNNAMFIAARNGRQASPVTVSVLRPRVSLDVDVLNTLDAEEIRLSNALRGMFEADLVVKE